MNEYYVTHVTIAHLNNTTSHETFALSKSVENNFEIPLRWTKQLFYLLGPWAF